ncbi:MULTISPECIES: hypothetical protein [unclassified Novosphingobium]|uniref:hypothetical protein n=1 Tax=unclassified Novosphingobium TaxID=2644732 RepID=UPI000D30DD01|nr:MULTISPECIES: hypothetical protein [unclassified Novosphingobium]PTR11765.1 hypothetical protein C8K11_104124 [Novosphingobium sp. GV055]PUB04805.1 hypothetical protein C8K12_104124 [Novosphingobium sp. GV061]PUB21124.1 hypothetical protein C8K14_104124 [Novosphingobium sp. GV079]PUB42850.1 hypothetical protein C8K10_104124 [Novosphingobium sp. GV027]
MAKRAPWKWYATLEGETDEYAYESDTREAAIAAIAADFGAGTAIEVVEARFSVDERYEGHDFVPFIAMRNAEKITLGPRAA